MQDGMVKDLKTLGAVALGFVILAITVVLSTILLTEFKSLGFGANGTTLINNTIDTFIAAILVFGSFSSVLALVAMVKIIVRVVKTT